jgi:hypothetical protein
MSDSRFLDAVGFSEMYDVTDEGGWAYEVLPTEDIGFAGIAARVETELDLLPPLERELCELAWGDMGFQQFLEAEDLSVAAARPQSNRSEEEAARRREEEAAEEEGEEEEGWEEAEEQ